MEVRRNRRLYTSSMNLNKEKKVLWNINKDSYDTEVFCPWEYNSKPAPCLVIKNTTFIQGKNVDKGELLSRGWNHAIYSNEEIVEIMLNQEEAIEIARRILKFYEES